ncbi:MAG: NAD-dependent epimerase/dehydratase family protein [Chloroflexi bacterium]|nr:NAD-dependent epimerase/dehydratase family protein [Chloroflexota bacterium]
MRVLVTGAAGFMGSHAVDRLLELGHEVTAADSLIGGYVDNMDPAAEFVECDLADRAAARGLVESAAPDVIFHYAADATEGRSQFTPLSSMDNNVVGYLNTLVPAIAQGLSKVVLVSSMSVYGAQQAPFDETMPRLPEDVYAAMKASMEAATEHLSAVHGFDYAVFRPHNVYGERQNLADPYRNVVAIFINALLRDRAIHIYGDGEQRRAYSYIGDVNPAIVDGGLSQRSNGRVFNIGSSEDVSINQLADVVRDVFFDGGAWPEGQEPIYLPPRPLEVKNAYCTHDAAEQVLGFRNVTSLRAGVEAMVRWARTVGSREPVYLPNSLEIGSERAPATWRDQLI